MKIQRTEKGNLVSNLRAEVGEIIETWILYGDMIAQQGKLVTDDVQRDIENRHLSYLSTLSNKMEDEMVARLSGLAEMKIGQLTFHFAAAKLGALHNEEAEYRKFIVKHQFKKRRNWNISHKRLPEERTNHEAAVDIPYSTIVKAIARALRLMKKIDRLTLGPSAPFCWREMLKRRYDLAPPARVAYLLLPYLYLSGDDRLKIMAQEEQAGDDTWCVVNTVVDGKPAHVRVCKEWGAVYLGGSRVMMLQQYPLHELKSINTETTLPSTATASNSDDTNGRCESRVGLLTGDTADSLVDRRLHERRVQMALVENPNGHTGAHRNPDGTWVVGGAHTGAHQNPDGTWVCGGAHTGAHRNPDSTWVCGGAHMGAHRNPNRTWVVGGAHTGAHRNPDGTWVCP